MCVDEVLCDGLRGPDGVVVAGGESGDECSLEEDFDAFGECVGFVECGGACEGGEFFSGVCEVFSCGGVDGVVWGWELGAGRHEDAALVAWVAEPFVERFEEGDDGVARRAVGVASEGFGKGGVLPSVPHLDGGDDEVVFAFEVVVEGGFGDADVFDDSVDADGVEAVDVEEVECCCGDAVACVCDWLGRREELAGGCWLVLACLFWRLVVGFWVFHADLSGWVDSESSRS